MSVCFIEHGFHLFNCLPSSDYLFHVRSLPPQCTLPRFRQNQFIDQVLIFWDFTLVDNRTHHICPLPPFGTLIPPRLDPTRICALLTDPGYICSRRRGPPSTRVSSRPKSRIGRSKIEGRPQPAPLSSIIVSNKWYSAFPSHVFQSSCGYVFVNSSRAAFPF